MATRLKVTVRYDGTDFAGWQIQPGLRTIQGVIEEALAQIASRPVRIHAASRTDAGVHALGQVFSCDWPGSMTPERLGEALSKMLRPDVRIERIEEAPPGFHARFDARGKRYAYTLDLSLHADPFLLRYAWLVPWPLDIEHLGALAQRLVGTHDFAGFQAAGTAVKVTTRTISSIGIESSGVVAPCDASSLARLVFHGDGFLYKMVRNITGTLVDIARGNQPEGRLEELLASVGPYRGFTAPAHGLTLLEVLY
ncbi:MAG TPA: tRNA pseudouridine(38-40) synthase TruA [Candidatus Hydrogenedentes bacterium]|nr:tRNA pseudouridine(38-40) synthase TruA [Candidatus Hydrogenedentota bacterium]